MKCKQIAIFVAPGTEEVEALGIVDVLRRGNQEVTIVSIGKEKTVVGAHNIVITADKTLEEVSSTTFDAVVLPGGLPGAFNLCESKELGQLLNQHHDNDKVVCAMCAAPMMLGQLGLLKGKTASTYPSFEKYLEGAEYSEAGVSVHGNTITGRGPGYVFDFALAILEHLTSKEVADEVAAGMLLHEKK